MSLPLGAKAAGIPLSCYFHCAVRKRPCNVTSFRFACMHQIPPHSIHCCFAEERAFNHGRVILGCDRLHRFRLAQQEESHGILYGIQISSSPSPQKQTVLNSPTNLIPALAGFISPLTPHRGPLCVPLCTLICKAFPLNLAVSDVPNK